MNIIKSVYHKFLLVPGVPSFFRFARRTCATVFMMHRFAHKDRGIVGFDAEQLRKGLQYLRKHKYDLISLTELISRLKVNGAELNGAVAFTIDDGYIDHAEIACPIFAEFDCPVTTFAVSGFLDGTVWMWWNKIEYIFSRTPHKTIEIAAGGGTVNYALNEKKKIADACNDFIEICKKMEEGQKNKVILTLAKHAEVDLPDNPPDLFAPMTWDHARACEKKGMSFGPHTVTHPIMSQTTEKMAEWEIAESWGRLRDELQNPIPVFCYPNGQFSDFGNREIAICKKLAISGAVVGVSGFAEPISNKDNDWMYKIPRFPYPETLSDLIQYVSGIERCKHKVRSVI